MFPGAFLLFPVICAYGFLSAEISSHRWPAQRRGTSNDLQHYRHQFNNETNSKLHNAHYNVRPMYRYNYGLNERIHTANWRQHSRKIERKDAPPYTTGIYKSYGRGKAILPELGATVSVSNSIPRPKIHKGTITARVLTPSLGYNEATPRKVARNRRTCIGCPQNRAVVASRGNAHVVLPEPCPTLRWMSISGPKPGALIPEGTHSLIGRLGYRGKICQYEYEVVVRHCGTFNVKSGNANCTIDDAWGSVCNITCEDGYELVGSRVLECSDELKWSNEPPICKKKRGCPLPQMPDNAKFWCQVPDERDLTEDVLPAETYCRFKSGGRQRVITCVEGYWVNKRARGRRNHRTVKRRKSKKFEEDQVKWKNKLGRNIARD